MSFLRHRGIYRPMNPGIGSDRTFRRPHCSSSDEFPSWLFLGGLLSSRARLRFTNWHILCEKRDRSDLKMCKGCPDNKV